MIHARPFGLAVILTVLIFSSSIHPACAASCPGLAAPAAIGTALTDVLYDPVAGVMKACVGGSWVSLGTGGGGGASALSGLSDVSVTGIGDGKSLVYNGTSSKWEPQTVSGGGGSTTLAGLTDIDTTGIADGKSLVYNATSSKWVPMTVTSGGSGTVSGTIGKLAKFTGTSAVGDSIITESGGNIGIGTTSPATRLDVSGAGFSPSANATSALALSGAFGGGLIFRDGAYGGIWMTDSGQTMNFSTNGTTSGFGAATGPMVLKNGAVGIGTTTPSSQLHVYGNSAITLEDTTGMAFIDIKTSAGGGNYGGDIRFIDSGSVNAEIRSGANDYLYFSTGATGTNRLTISTAGNVGIGTTSPNTTLDVRGGAVVTNLSFQNSSGTVYPDNWLGVATNVDGANNKWLHIGGITDNTDGTGAKRRIGLFADRTYFGGNVGIGTTSPTERLDIGGGNIKMGYQLIAATCGTSAICDMNCPAGTQVISGGCYAQNNPLTESRPISATTWRCQTTGASINWGSSNSIICANIK